MKKLMIAAIAALAMLSSCEKERLASPIPTNSKPSTIDFRSGDPDETILGSLRTNPYTVAIMTQAWNNVYKYNQVSQLPTTHKYVMFTPSALNQVDSLIADDLDLFDFPMEYEILHLGEYYSQPGKGDWDIPDLYTVVPNDYVFRGGISYTVLEELVLAPYNSYLTAEAFRLTGNQHLVRNPTLSECVETCITFPCCLVEDVECDDDGYICNVSPDCLPGAQDWPECLNLDLGDDPGSGVTNECGCEIPFDARTPAGCIQVEDTQFSNPQPVKDVKVKWYNGWFTVLTTSTDENGCFKFSGHRERGSARMWVKFKNDRCKVRRMTGVKIWQMWTSIRDFHRPEFPFFDEKIIYGMWSGTSNDAGQQAHRYWAGATVVNGVHDFHDFAGQYGILPPERLSISVNPKRGTNVVGGSGLTQGAAPMVPHMSLAQVTAVVNGGMLSSEFFLPDLHEILALLSPTFPFVAVAYSFVPDVYMGSNEVKSDVFHTLIFHELAHASHFRKAGGDFWQQVSVAEMTNDGWGDNNTVYGAGTIALVEGWAEMIGFLFADERYGPDHSQVITWAEKLERSRNVYTDYIPVGLHYDIVDDHVDDILSSDLRVGGLALINDQIDNITLAQLYGLLIGTTEDVEDYKALILQTLISGSGNTQQELVDLFEDYAY